jgi:hypothetical protein
MVTQPVSLEILGKVRLGYVKASQTAESGKASYGAFYGLGFTFICVCGILLFLLPVNLVLALDFGTKRRI